MANDNQFCIRLKSFSSVIQTTWQQLQNVEDFCDVTLACDDKQIQVHKVVISSSSPVFRNILKSNSNSHPFIYLRGVKYKDLASLVNFMYQGEVNIEEENLEMFLATAEDLQVKGLCEQNEGAFLKELAKTDMNTSAKRECIIDSYNANLDDKKSETIDQYSNKQEKMQENIIQSSQIISPKNKNEQIYYSKLNTNKQNAVSLNKEGSFSCDQCDKSFTMKGNLRTHSASAHEGIRYTCDKCDYKASQKGSLKAHIMAVHEGIRYPCSQCEFTATFKPHVNKHVKKCH